jgi:hypothetical protein
VRRDERERLEVEALLTDRYLESLFVSLDRHAVTAPADVDLEPDVRAAAGLLAAELDRVHPSFRFEERLAARLQEVAAQLRAGDPTAVADIIPFTPARRRSSRRVRRPLPSVSVDRPLLIGGALTSAALSVAGAYVAWRRGGGAGSLGQAAGPMARAVRAAHGRGRVERRLLDAALAAGGRGGRRGR